MHRSKINNINDLYLSSNVALVGNINSICNVIHCILLYFRSQAQMVQIGRRSEHATFTQTHSTHVPGKFRSQQTKSKRLKEKKTSSCPHTSFHSINYSPPTNENI